MHSKPNFIDTNIILSSLIGWNYEENHKKANKYFDDNNINKITSRRVFNEAKTKLSHSRRNIGQFLQITFEQNYSININQIESSLKRIMQTNFKNEKTQKQLNTFIENNYPEIYSYTSSPDKFDEYLTKIIKDINQTIKILLISCSQTHKTNQSQKIILYTICPDDYISKYNVEYSNLKKIINYSNDSLVIMDAFFIANNLDKNIFLVTLDKQHIISNKIHIEKLLPKLKIFDFNQYN